MEEYHEKKENSIIIINFSNLLNNDGNSKCSVSINRTRIRSKKRSNLHSEIPAKITIAKDGSDMTIKASNVNYLDGQKVSVSIAGTDYFRNQMVLTNKETNTVMRYQIVKEDGTVIETTGTKDQANGVEIAAFTEDGEVNNKVLPVKLPSSKVGTYTGSITFDIGLVDAE